jgi:DNA polymerase III subunit delta
MTAKEKNESGSADKAVHLVFGEDEYLVSTSAKDLVDRLCPKADQAFGLEIVEARVDLVADAIAAIGRCLDGLRTLGFLGGRKVVWLRDATFLGSGVIGESADVKNRLDDLVKLIKAGLPQGQMLVVSALKVDGRSAFFKACQSAGNVTKFELPDKSYQLEQQARGTASDAFRKIGLSIGPDALEEFLDKTGTDTRQIVQEVEKLSVYLGDRKSVQVADVQAIVSPSREAISWDLADAVGNRDLAGTLKVLRQLLFQGENEVGLIISLENRFRDLLMYREAMDRKWLNVSGQEPWLKVEWRESPEVDAFASALSKDPRATNIYRAGKLVAQAKRYSRQELIRCQALTLSAHETIVSSTSAKELMLEFLLIKILGAARQASANARSA